MGWPFTLQEGWEELPRDLITRIENLGPDRWQEFWYAAGRGDVRTAIPILYDAGMLDFTDWEAEREPIVEDLFIMEVPDEMQISRMRIWAKTLPWYIKQDEEEEDTPEGPLDWKPR
jgi:hypothetical protein